uniref:Sulfatase-modifying factor 1 n=1 Tax=Stylophora pistillata TaxID=50429 RepID=A0A2B4RD36_STYPI
MVWIPSGTFTMGGESGTGKPDELPKHKVTLDGFWIDATEISNADFEKFVKKTGYQTTAETLPNWDEIKKTLPKNTPRPHDIPDPKAVLWESRTPVSAVFLARSASELDEVIVRTSDGGFIVAGHTSSIGAGKKDFMVLKLDKDGNKQWLKTFGGAEDDEAEDIIQSSDGGYVVAGWTGNTGDRPANKWNYMVLKLDSSGTQVWEKKLGGKISSTDDEEGRAVVETSDGNFVVGGHMYDYTVDNTMDIYLFKLNKDTGNVIWENKWGGILTDLIYSMKTTKDGGFIIAGLTGSNSNKIRPRVNALGLLLKLDENGNHVWHKAYGVQNSIMTVIFQNVIQTSDGGFFVVGYKMHRKRFRDKNKEKYYDEDAWILRLDKNGDL